MLVPGSANPLLLKSAAAAAGGLQISRSLRFNSSDSAYLSKVFAVAGNQKTWTWSGWIKRSKLGTEQRFFDARDGGSQQYIKFNSNDALRILDSNGTLITSQVFRDLSAWYHVLIAFDTTQSTASNRIKLYVNGLQVTTFSSESYPTQNSDILFNSACTHSISWSAGTTEWFDGYLTNIHFINGQQLTPSSFTETDATTGQLIPKTYSGSYGTNGFNLLFADNSSNTASTLGKDTSGNSPANNWTPNNFSVGFSVTQNYRLTTTGAAPTPFLSTSTYANAFDGNTSTGFAWNTGTWAMDWTGLPSAVTVSSSLRIFCYPRLGTLTVNINGNNVASITGNTVDWRTISFTGTINTISFTGTDTYASVYAIEVNGAILVDPVANSVNDSLVDSPTNGAQTDTGAGGEVRGNYCTLNPLAVKASTGLTFSQGNLRVSGTTNHDTCHATIPVSSGKWYWEAIVDSAIVSTYYPSVGAIDVTAAAVRTGTQPGGSDGGVCYMANGQKYENGSLSSYGSSYTQNDVIGMALDMDAGTLTSYKNGVSQGTLKSGITGTWTVTHSVYSSALFYNFGQRAFAYSAPSGFKALCTANLPGTTITTSGTYTGNGVADGPFVYLNGVPTAMTIGGNAVTFGTHADKLSNGFKIRTTSTTYNQNANTYSYSITTTGAAFKYSRAQPNP